MTLESVFFYTFHKSASTLFDSYVLPKARGLVHVDYAKRIYSGQDVDVAFERRGFVYGPLRLSSGPGNSREWKLLVGLAATDEFVRDKITVIQVRDPRDMLVSQFYSFGWTHGLSSEPSIRANQEKQRSQIQSMSVDAYVLNTVRSIKVHMESASGIARACPRHALLRYEDMIHDWSAFSGGLTQYLDLDEESLKVVYAESRPRTTEDRTSHKRSGKPGGFRDVLAPATVASLNIFLGDVLDQFGYTP